MPPNYRLAALHQFRSQIAQLIDGADAETAPRFILAAAMKRDSDDGWNSRFICRLGLICCWICREREAMRTELIALSLVGLISIASGIARAEDKPVGDPANSAGRPQVPETTGQKQPQGWTGPIETGTGGAPASSPQGQSPPAMQPAPEGSSQTTVEPTKTK